MNRFKLLRSYGAVHYRIHLEAFSDREESVEARCAGVQCLRFGGHEPNALD